MRRRGGGLLTLRSEEGAAVLLSRPLGVSSLPHSSAFRERKRGRGARLWCHGRRRRNPGLHSRRAEGKKEGGGGRGPGCVRKGRSACARGAIRKRRGRGKRGGGIDISIYCVSQGKKARLGTVRTMGKKRGKKRGEGGVGIVSLVTKGGRATPTGIAKLLQKGGGGKRRGKGAAGLAERLLASCPQWGGEENVFPANFRLAWGAKRKGGSSRCARPSGGGEERTIYRGGEKKSRRGRPSRRLETEERESLTSFLAEGGRKGEREREWLILTRRGTEKGC